MISIDIDREQVYHCLGYGAEPPARISSLIDDYLENAHKLIEPSYSYVIRDIERVQDSRVFIEGSVMFQSKVIARLLEQCHKVAVFLVTIGDYLEETVGWLAKRRLILQATLLDAVGSDAVEKMADSVQSMIGELANKQGLVISQRFSPGYCDWDIGQQKEIFRVVNGNLAGVHLTGGCLMVPQKSISGIVGIGNDEVESYNPCKTCPDRYSCRARR